MFPRWRASQPSSPNICAGLGDDTEFHLDKEALERDGFGPTPAFAGLVAEMANWIIGYALFHDGYDTDAAHRVVFIVDLMVTHTMRSKGVGSALMREVSSVAVARGAKQLVWTMDRRNAEAIRFYKNVGGQLVNNLSLMCLDVKKRSN
jgi:GNAT superfamily N-acetyltransferase